MIFLKKIDKLWKSNSLSRWKFHSPFETLSRPYVEFYCQFPTLFHFLYMNLVHGSIREPVMAASILCAISALVSWGNGGGGEVAWGGGHSPATILSGPWTVRALCVPMAVANQWKPVWWLWNRCWRRLMVGKDSMWASSCYRVIFYRGGVVGGGESWTTIGRQ
jgi:hypothetical protein